MGKFLSLVLLYSLLTVTFSQSIELISPNDNFQTYEKSLSFNIFYNSSSSDYDLADCDLFIGGANLAQAQLGAMASHQFTPSSLSVGVHSWQVICDQINSSTGVTLTDSLTSVSRDFEILPTPASLEIISPSNNFQTNSRQILVSFIYSAKDTGSSNPTCYLESGVSRLAQTTAAEGSLTELSATFQYGSHNWRIRCVDSGFELSSPIYSLHVSSPPIASGGGAVGTPYKREIGSPNPIEGPLSGPISGPLTSDSSLTNLNENIEPKPIPPPQLNKAVLAAPQQAIEGENVILRALTSGGQPIQNAQIHIIDPRNEIIYITTDSKGAAHFSAALVGLYMYKMPDYELVSLPTTQITQKPVPATKTANEISAPVQSQVKEEPQTQSQEQSWLFWGAISAAFIFASFLLLMRFSKDE